MVNPLHDALFGRHAGRADPVLHLPDGAAIGYDAFLARSRRFAQVLSGLGAEPGDRVAVQVGKSPDGLALFAACVAAGVVYVPLNPGYTAAELSGFVEDCGAAIFVCAPDDAESLQEMAESADARLLTLGTEGDGTLAYVAEEMDGDFAALDRDEDDLAAILYTSGTTGRSKGAMLTQGNLLSNARTLVRSWRFTADDVLLHALPIFHSHGLFVAANVVLLSGGSMIFLPKFDLDAVIAWLPKATSMMGVPTFYTRLLGDTRLDADLTRHVRLFTSGSAALPAGTHHSFEARTGHRILERYGMTETGLDTSNPYDGERRPGTVGFPLPGVELRITDPETGAEVSPGDTGMIEVRGPNVFPGYWRMPEKTAETLRDDGFFITGDLGVVDGDGYVSIVGRATDLVISGGLNVYPSEVETALDDQPGVLESAVIGVPHPDLGEGVVGILVASPGETPDLDAISAALAERLARYKQPKRLEVVAALPRNAMGKVQKTRLRERYAGTFEG